jgi:hypothetical protein
MNKCVGKKTPDLATVQNGRALKLQIWPQRIRTKRTKDARDNGREYRDRNMQSYQHRRHVDRVASHPRNRTIIIGGSHSEHAFN